MQLVELQALLPDAIIDLRYASSANILGRSLYEAGFTARLADSAAQALTKVCDALAQQDYKLVIWDAFRPQAVQQELLALNLELHDTYVLQDSNHCRGQALDITIATNTGEYLDMGTDHDDFSDKAHVDSSQLTPEQMKNRAVLTNAMQTAGFTTWPYEWWHFDYTGAE